MAIQLSSKVLVDTKKLVLIQFSAYYPGAETEEVNAVKVDASALTGEFTSTNLKIMRIWYSNNMERTVLNFDGTTQKLALPIPKDAAGFIDYRGIGGLRNTASTPTGDISLSCFDTAVEGHCYQITLELAKT